MSSHLPRPFQLWQSHDRYLTTGTNEKELLLLNDQIYIPVFRNPVLRSGNYLALAPAQFVYPLFRLQFRLQLIMIHSI